MIHVCVMTYARDITPLVQAVGDQDIVWHIWEHSDNEQVNAAVDRLHENHHLRVNEYRFNRGLGRSANDFLIDAQKMKADVMLLPNDDITWTRADFDKLVQGCRDHLEAGIITCTGFDMKASARQDLSYCVFGINRIAIEKVGYFDENLPDYFVDCDYTRRCFLRDVPFHSVGDTSITHIGSATLDAVPALREQLQRTFPADHDYFVKKWGGEPYAETFTHPFNDKRLSSRIPVERRDNPYPEHRRPVEELTRI